MDFEFGFAKPQPHRKAVRSEDAPTRILVLGNFSRHGNGGSAAQPISERTLHALDTDTFDSVLARLKPRIHLEAVGNRGASLDIEIGELDDFHPDALYRRLDIFRSLREMRQRLLDPATFAQAAAELNPIRTDAPPDSAPAAEGGDGRDATVTPEQPAPPEDDAATVERLLGRQASIDVDSSTAPTSFRGGPHPPGKVDLTALIRGLVAPYVVPEGDPRQDVYVDSLDVAIRDQMRFILHHPSFQAVESASRARR